MKCDICEINFDVTVNMICGKYKVCFECIDKLIDKHMIITENKISFRERK